VQASASQPPDPHLKALLFISRWDVVWLCIHWVVQDTKQHPFLFHVGSIYTTCVFLVMSKQQTEVSENFPHKDQEGCRLDLQPALGWYKLVTLIERGCNCMIDIAREGQ
jgi:hypothetical protein